MIHLFRPRGTPADIRLSNLNETNMIGLDMINTIKDQMPAMRRCIDDLQARLSLLENTINVYERQVTATATVTGRPIETAASVDILNRIMNQEDFQHQFGMDEDSKEL